MKQVNKNPLSAIASNKVLKLPVPERPATPAKFENLNQAIGHIEKQDELINSLAQYIKAMARDQYQFGCVLESVAGGDRTETQKRQILFGALEKLEDNYEVNDGVVRALELCK